MSQLIQSTRSDRLGWNASGPPTDAAAGKGTTMSVGGSGRAARHYVSLHAVTNEAGIAHGSLEQLVAAAPGVRIHAGPAGEQLVSMPRLQPLLASRMPGGPAAAGDVLRRVRHTDGALFIQEARGVFVPAGSLAAADAARAAASLSAPSSAVGQVALAAATRLLMQVRERPALASAVGGGGIAGALLASAGGGGVPGVGTAGVSVAPTAPEAVSARTRAADLARAQVGVVDTTADGSLEPRVAAFTSDAGPVEPSRYRDWTPDFVGWAWKSAGHPVGPEGAGVETVAQLEAWARSGPAWVGSGFPDEAQAIGTIALLSRDGDERADDAAIVTAVDGEYLEIVAGNRLADSRADGSSQDGVLEVGGVLANRLHRDDPMLVGFVDPARVPTVQARPPARAAVPSPAAPRPPAPAPASTTAIPKTKLDTDGDTFDRALYIAQEFEAANMPGVLGVATAMLESHDRIDPNVRNRIGFMGMFQTKSSGRGGDGRYADEVRRAERLPESRITSVYPAAHQVADAVTWFDRFRPAGAGGDTSDPRTLQAWSMKAQGVNLRNNPKYAEMPQYLERATALLDEARRRGPSKASQP